MTRYIIFYLRNIRTGFDLSRHKKNIKELFCLYDNLNASEFRTVAELLESHSDMVLDIVNYDVDDSIDAIKKIIEDINTNHKEAIFITFVKGQKLLKR